VQSLWAPTHKNAIDVNILLNIIFQMWKEEILKLSDYTRRLKVCSSLFVAFHICGAAFKIAALILFISSSNILN